MQQHIIQGATNMKRQQIYMHMQKHSRNMSQQSYYNPCKQCKGMVE